MAGDIILTIGRQYGSGGRIVGKALAEELGIGEITLRDIVKELEKPARDPQRKAA